MKGKLVKWLLNCDKTQNCLNLKAENKEKHNKL